MTNLQFIALLSPAIGSLVLVILAWLNQNQRLSDLNGDVREFSERRDKPFPQIDRRLALSRATRSSSSPSQANFKDVATSFTASKGSIF